MPTTSKMGIVYPSSSDLVKDGATAMGTIATTVDNKTGLILLNTTSFSAVASQAITPVFSSTYQNYKIILTITANSGSNTTRIRLRSGATNATGSNYGRAGYYNYTANTSGTLSQAGATSMDLGNQNSAAAARTVYVMDMANPFLAQETTVTGSWGVQDTSGFLWAGFSFLHDLATSYDGFAIIVDAGTITGKVSVYGYNL